MRRPLAIVGLVLSLLAGSQAHIAQARITAPARVPVAFSPDSYWRLQIPADTPVDPQSDRYIADLEAFGDPGYPQLTTDDWSDYAYPAFRAYLSDPVYTITDDNGYVLPPLHIPKNAQPNGGSDATMVIWSPVDGVVVGLTGARWDGLTWHAAYSDVYYLASNGLDHRVDGSNEPRNRGHRGVPPPERVILLPEVQAGQLNHVLRLTIQATADCFVYPMYDDEGGPGTLCEGTVVRVKPDVDLEGLGLTGCALLVARALQTYGAIVGDRGGQPATINMQNLSVSGIPHSWTEYGCTRYALAPLTWDHWEVMELGFHR